LNEQANDIEHERRAIVAEQQEYSRFWGNSDDKLEGKIQEMVMQRNK